MKVVALMAGTCNRLKPLTDLCHKVLLPIGHKTLLEHQLEILSTAGIDEAVCVVGHGAHLITSLIGDCYHGLPVTYVYNPEYKTRTMGYSLLVARKYVNGPFIYMEADMLFHPAILQRILDSEYENCLCVDDNPKSFKVDTLVCGNHGTVNAFMCAEHGDIKNAVTHNTVLGEFISMIKFNKKSADIIFQRLKKASLKNESVLYSIFEKAFFAVDTGYLYTDGLPWIEIDNYSDLEKARTEIYPQLKQYTKCHKE